MSEPSLSLTRDQVREVDRLAIEELGLPGVVLMENAGRGATDIALSMLRERAGPTGALPSTLIVCGGGNNGGDGWVVARHLVLAGARVSVAALQPAERTRGDAATMRRIVDRMQEIDVHDIAEGDGLELARERFASTAELPGLVVDALLGTGFRGTPRVAVARAIEWIRELRAGGAAVLALDVPSGLDCETGSPSEPTVRADRTATFVAWKSGFAAADARSVLGKVDVVSIGAPPSLIERVREAGS